MEAAFRDSSSRAFVMRSEDLSTLASVIASTFSHGFKISVKCADGLTRSFATLEEFNAFGNPSSKSIRSLSIHGFLPSIDGAATVEFAPSAYAENVEIRMEAPEEVVGVARAVIFDCLAVMRPWYDPIARFNWIPTMYALLGAFSLGAYVVGTIKSNSPSAGGGEASPSNLLVVVGVIAFPLLCGWGLNAIRDSVFPRAVFAFGDAKARHANGETIRTAVVVALVVSVLGSVIATLLLTSR